jgi:CheY-like chemotaxis protein
VEGYAVSTADGGGEALDILEEQMPDLILSDIKMPDVDGVALFREVRARGHQMPFVGMSGHLCEDGGVGFDAFLEKPFRMQALIDAVGQVLSGQPVA